MVRRIALFLFVFFILFYYETYEVIDLKQYENATKKVEVKGAVEKPGVYEVELHASVEDILKLAQLKANSDVSNLNLSFDIENQGVIVVDEISEKHKISINNATLEELDQLNGIGEATALRIIEYRSHTPFKQIEDIMQVKGIKQKLFEKIKDDICL